AGREGAQERAVDAPRTAAGRALPASRALSARGGLPRAASDPRRRVNFSRRRAIFPPHPLSFRS
ncbi:hypothetical protein, partial [Burkholderia multivorans]|uniref:hypothetical protein n=1 Tax=Burkholderia multivorans TaxID=87883 RepID=UPI001F327613